MTPGVFVPADMDIGSLRCPACNGHALSIGTRMIGVRTAKCNDCPFEMIMREGNASGTTLASLYRTPPDGSEYKVMRLSTAHITQEDSELLEHQCDCRDGICAHTESFLTDYGCVIRVTIEISVSTLMELGYSKEFAEIINGFGKDKTVAFVEVDCDGPEVEGLKIFDW